MGDFIKWCFRDENAGAATIVVLLVVFYGIVRIIRAIKE